MDLNNKVKPHVSSAPSKHRRESEPEPRRQSWTIEEKSYTKCSPPVLEYMEKSSLHGLQYLAEDGRHWTERLLWTFLVVLGFVPLLRVLSSMYNSMLNISQVHHNFCVHLANSEEVS